MEQTSSKILAYKHISSSTSEIVKYIKDRRSKQAKSLATRWPKFNKLSMGGIEPGIIMSIAGISGSGDVVFFNTIK